jgi:hypothetical protein
MRKHIYFIIGLIFFVSCSEDENLVPIVAITTEDGIDRIILDGTQSNDPDGGPVSFQWTTAESGISIQNASQSKAYFKIPSGTGGDVTVNLTVKDGKGASVSQQIVSVPALTAVRSFGLGKILEAETDNTAPYEWYFDQANTGSASLVNCGPTSVTMAVKWASPSFTGTPQDARNMFPNDGGWWFTSDIINYLNNKSIANWTVQLANMDVVKAEIDAGNIVVLCLDMFYVSEGTSEDYRLDKFYDTDGKGWGHFIVVKGYKEVDDKLFYEVFDPYSFGKKYTDQTLKGRNRYYRSEDLDKATGIWWDYAIVVSRNSSDGGRKAVNTSNIVHMPGR